MEFQDDYRRARKKFMDHAKALTGAFWYKPKNGWPTVIVTYSTEEYVRFADGTGAVEMSALDGEILCRIDEPDGYQTVEREKP